MDALAELDGDAGFHEYGIRAALLDYGERFGASRLAEALTRALSPFHIEVSHVEYCPSHRPEAYPSRASAEPDYSSSGPASYPAQDRAQG